MPISWATIRDDAAKYFSELVRGFESNNVLTLSADCQNLYLGPLDWSWGTDQEISSKLDSVKILYALRCNQVEMLITEAGLLIERALGDVLKYDELNLERFKVMVEFCEYLKTYHQEGLEEKDDEYWNGPAKEAALSSQAAATPTSMNFNEISTYNDDITTETNNARLAAEKVDNELTRYNARAEWMGAVNSAESESHNARTKYEIQSRIHQAARRRITQEIVGIKLNEMKKGDRGALNYNQRMQAAAERAQYDFLEVVARLNAIAIGLREFYSVTDLPDIDDELRRSRTRIEGALNWVRRATNALARARMDEQESVARLTIESQGTKTLLEELTGGRPTPFPGDLVDHTKSTRLRGVSATVEPTTGDSWIDIEVTCPQQKLVSTNITLPPVTARLGRVSSSASLNIRDLGGGRPIINRSPMGDWMVRAIRHNGAEQIRRLHMDFHLAFC